MVTERIQIDRVVTETVSQPLHRDTGVPMDEEYVISFQEDPNFHLEYHSRFPLDRLQSPWALFQLTSSRRKFTHNQCHEEIRGTVKSILGLGLQSAKIDVVDHYVLSVSMLDEVRNP